MKIGILTLSPGHNYGGILQVYALQTTLEKMGHQVKVIKIDRFHNINHPSQYFRYFVRFIRKYFFHQEVCIFSEKIEKERYYSINKELLEFCKRQLNQLIVSRLKKIRENDFDAIVVGSDQVWRPLYFKAQLKTTIADAYLKFANTWNIKRVAYATSFGVDVWEYTPKETKECALLLKRFDAISVREHSAVELCKQYLQVEAECLCDPTFLLSKEEYEKLVDFSTPNSKGNLLVYCLDQNKELDLLVSELSDEYSMIPFYTNINEKQSDIKKVSVESWIRGFMDADFIITDSFHACVFSIIFRKPFVVLGNTKRGLSRFETLLNTFGLNNRLITKSSQFSPSLLSENFDNIDIIVNRLKERSFKFLNDSLKI